MTNRGTTSSKRPLAERPDSGCVCNAPDAKIQQRQPEAWYCANCRTWWAAEEYSQASAKQGIAPSVWAHYIVTGNDHETPEEAVARKRQMWGLAELEICLQYIDSRINDALGLTLEFIKDFGAEGVPTLDANRIQAETDKLADLAATKQWGTLAEAQMALKARVDTYCDRYISHLLKLAHKRRPAIHSRAFSHNVIQFPGK